MSARAEILSRVRRAQLAGDTPGREPTPREYRRAGIGVPTTDELVALLTDRLLDYKAGVTPATEADAAQVITSVLARHRARTVVLPDGLPALLAPTAVKLVRDAPPLSASALDEIDAVVTTSAVAIAETGTIVLDAGPGMGRRALTLVVDLHVVVVLRDDVVRGVPEALTRLEPMRPLTWISGPSATSDIELNRVEGVHGPRRLEVVVVG